MNVPQERTNSGRYHQIAEVLVRHGFGYLTESLDLERFIPFHREISGHPLHPEPYTRPEHVCLALAELGTTFIKLGQIVSTRSDLVSPEYQFELAKLQDAAPTIAIAEIRETLLTELGLPLEQLFAHFDPVPLAAASIGQAHAATQLDGTEVVVKVRRPGVVEQVEADLSILHTLVARASHHWEIAKQYDLVTLVQEFGQTLREELDYIHEGRNAERFAANFSGNTDVHIPRIFWDTTTARVLTLERIHGMKINDVEALAAAGIDRKELAVRSSRILLKMVFEDGFFHADPHPGNFFVEPGGRIGILDFGMVGVVDDRTQEHLVSILLAITSQDMERLSGAFLELGMEREHIDREALQRDLQHLISRYYGQPLGEIAVRPLLEDVLGMVRRHRLQLPSSLALLLKTILMSEGMGVQLDPAFRLTVVLAPYAQQLMLRQYSPRLWARRFTQAGLDAARLGVELPEQVRRILGDLERGKVEVGVRPKDLEPLLQRAEQLINRLVLGIIAAAFIVGLAFLVSVYHPIGGEAWIGAFFAIGFVIAAMLGLYLAWSILRSGPG